MRRTLPTRRACLCALVGVPAELLARPFTGRISSSAFAAPPLRLVDDVSALLPRQSAVAIGSEYLRTHRDESLEGELAHALESAYRATGASSGPGRLARCLQSAVRADFRHRRMVRVNNWHLAVTEARLCALIVLRDRESFQTRQSPRPDARRGL